jgi:hypothetical protein
MTAAISSSTRHLSALPSAVARRWALALIVLSVALTTSAPARAAVPMCSDDGRSVAAPPIILPWRVLTLDAPKPCPPSDMLVLFGSLPAEQQRGPSSPPTPEPLRAVPVRVSDLPSPPASREPLISLDRPTCLELVTSVYRPPRR